MSIEQYHEKFNPSLVQGPQQIELRFSKNMMLEEVKTEKEKVEAKDDVHYNTVQKCCTNFDFFYNNVA